MQSLVIVGASFAGVSAAHYILRHVLSSIPPDWKVVMIGPSTSLFFKIAAPRAVVRPDLVPPTALMPNIPEAFSEYSSEKFEFIQAYATRLDSVKQEIQIEHINGSPTKQVISYNALILATGTSSESSLWSPRVPSEITLKDMEELHASLKPAKKIVVVGGGAAGVEVAGELGSQFGRSKDIALYSGGSHLLRSVRSSLGQDAEAYLKGMGVSVIHNTLLKSYETRNESTVLHFDNDETISADVFIPTTGGRPNNEFVPLPWLNDRGYVKVDCHLRVVDAGPKIYCLGSLASYSHGGILDVNDAIAPLGAVIEYDLSNGRSGKNAIFHRNDKENMIVPVGRSKAVGVVFNVKIPSFFAWLIKGRTFFVQNAEPYVRGDAYRKK